MKTERKFRKNQELVRGEYQKIIVQNQLQNGKMKF